jgi:PAS domain S-box-containing protein
LRDITNEIELNKQLKYSETKYKTLIENLNTPIFIIDKENYNIIETNFSAEIKLGLPLNKIKKMNLIELIKPDYINKFKNYAQNKTKTEDDKIEIEFVNSYNDFMIFDTVARNIKIYDKSYIQVICYDITENYLLSQNLIKSYNQLKDTQKNMIRAERLAAAGELAAGVSHEIKNRFQVISNALSYIEKKINMQEQGVKVNINYIKSEVKRGVELINDLMDFSKPHSLSKSMININEIIKSCFPLIKKQLEKKNIYYNENLGIIPNTFADYNMLQQVVMNIMKNAEESMIESGELSVTTECVHRNDINTIFDFENKSVYEKYIMIKIKDTGLGISEKNITKIFTPFFSTKDEAKGTGLGLSVSNSIIEEHNGFIDVESKQGQGTCFYIYLPVTENYED